MGMLKANKFINCNCRPNCKLSNQEGSVFIYWLQMEEGAGILMVDDVNMYLPFLHPLVVSNVDKVFCSFAQ